MKKKTFFVLSLAFMLLGLNLNPIQAQAEFVIPANSYTLSSSVGEFTDIADLGGTVKLGENLPHNTLLRNGFFINAVADADKFVTHFADKTKTDPGIPLGFNFILCGKKMTHFTICASGGIHFGASANIPQAQSAAWYTSTADFQNILTVSTRDTLNRQDSVLSLAGKAPVMYRIAGDAGQKVLTVQYDYTVNGDEWIYQIKVYEATGRMELIVKDLKNSHAGKGRYQMFFGLVENGNSSIKDDPLKTLNLHQCDNRRHKVGFNQAQAADWQTFNAYTTDGIGNGMHINANAKPETGRTLAFSIADCAENGACLNPEAYTFEITTVSKTAFSGKISYNKNALTADELAKTGTFVAVLSTSATPVTLNDGIWYRAGEQIGQARVLLNGKPGYRFYDGNISGTPGTLDIKADGLTAGTTYYLHIYSMNYQCLNAPTYSDLCHTFRFTSSIDLPKKLNAGLPTTSSVPVTVQAAGEGFGVVLLKSPNTNPVTLRGKLTEGQEIGDIKVLKIINSAEETSFDAPFEAGEGAYLLAVSATKLDSDDPTYAADFLSVPVRAAYDGLPVFNDFRQEPFTYGGPNEYRRLPFGWSRETEFPKGSWDLAFGLGKIGDGDPIYLTSYYPNEIIWADVITPAFKSPKSKIQVTFFTSYQKPSDGFSTVQHVPGETDLVRIEYSVNGGPWTKALDIHGAAEDFPQSNAQKQYPISASISGFPTNATLRLRYSYQSPNESAQICHTIHKVEITEGSDCETPRQISFADSLSTDGSLTLQWQDNNYPKAAYFVLSYRKATGNDTWKYRRINASNNDQTAASGTIPDLNAGTVYTARVAAVCNSRDTSIYSQPLTARTAYALPYEESMAQTGTGSTSQTPFDRGVKTYTGTIGGTLKETSQDGWTQAITSDPFNRATAVSIGDITSNAWLMLPAVFITETGNFIPKSIHFKLCSFDADKNKGVQPNFDDTKLHVLASNNGIFTRNSIIKTLNADELALENADIAIDLTEREGYLQVAFVFECPSAYDTSKNETEPWYIELSELSIDYDVDVCFPVSNLERTLGINAVPLTWKAPHAAVEYAILWGRNSEDGYTDTAYTKETHYLITGLEEQTRYKAMVIAYCSEDRSLYSEGATTRFTTLTGCHTPLDFSVSNITLTGVDFSSKSDQPDYMTMRLVYVWPENSENMFVFRQRSDTLSVHDSLRPKTNYIATTQAICGTDTSAMSDQIRFFTDTVTSKNEPLVQAMFNVHTQNGHVYIHNLNGALIKRVNVYNINGIKLADLRVESRDDLEFPVTARRQLIFVRLQTEKGMAVYKVYLQ